MPCIPCMDRLVCNEPATFFNVILGLTKWIPAAFLWAGIPVILATSFVVPQLIRTLRPWRRPLLLLFLGGLINHFMNVLLKTIVRSSSASKFCPYTTDMDRSFPSCPAQEAMFIVTWLLLSKERPFKMVVGLVLYSMVIVIGFAQISLQFHSLTDVLGGFIVGASVAVSNYPLADDAFVQASAVHFPIAGNKTKQTPERDPRPILSPWRRGVDD